MRKIGKLWNLIKTTAVGRFTAFRQWVYAYMALWAVIGLGLVASWPGWYGDPRLESIASGVFGTFLATPFLVFGVDQVLRRTEEARQKPRRAALMEELSGALAGCISLPALGNVETLLPGYLAKAVGVFTSGGQFDDEGVYLTNLLVDETLERHDEILGLLSQRGFEDLAKLMHAAGRQRDELQRRLFEAGDEVAPDLFVRVVRLGRVLRRLDRNAELADEIVSGKYNVTSPAALLLRTTFTTQYVDAVTMAAQVYRECQPQ